MVAEDMVMFRELITKICQETGHEVVGATGNGIETVQLCKKLQPDVLLLDLQLEDMDGCTTMEMLGQEIGRPNVLILSAHLPDYLVYRVERSIARGFVDKNTQTPAALSEALGALERGGTWFSSTFLQASRRRRSAPNAFEKILTDGEMQYLQLAAHGLPEEDISQKLAISVRTAEGYRSRILRKLGLENTPNLLLYARSKGFTFF